MRSSSEISTLERIQKEISEEVEREQELRRLQSQLSSHNGTTNGLTNGIHKTTPSNGDDHPIDPIKDDLAVRTLKRAQSQSNLNGDSNGISGSLNGTPINGSTNGSSSKLVVGHSSRLFTPSPHGKGVMHRFLKTRGKLNALTNFNNNNIPAKKSWEIPEFKEPTRVTIDPSKCVRRGFVSIEERMKKEFVEMHRRELELRKERRKSQPEFMSLCDDVEEGDVESPLRAARSMAQLYVPEDSPEVMDTSSAPGSLKPARSLAELCDVDDGEELLSPSTLISKFETIIKKNKQTRV